MYLTNNDTADLSTTKADPPSPYEWTMSRMNEVRSWTIENYGSVKPDYPTDSYSARPVFYLKSGLKLSGERTLEHPFMIADTEN